MQLASGEIVEVMVRHSEVLIGSPTPDKVKDYGHLVLELGSIFFCLLDLCKQPDREKMIGLLKTIMIILKSNNSHSKYALEILRWIMQQRCMLPEQSARQVFHQSFVNTKGRTNTHVPCDLVMEWQVRDEKRHIKHMISNKTESNILARSAALGGIEKISGHYDNVTNVRVRSKRHKTTSALEDERRIVEDLRKIRPFSHVQGRKFANFKNVPSTLLEKFDGFTFKSWFTKHKLLLTK